MAEANNVIPIPSDDQQVLVPVRLIRQMLHDREMVKKHIETIRDESTRMHLFLEAAFSR